MQALTLPYNATSNKGAIIVMAIMAISPFLTGAILFLALNLANNNLSPQLRQFVPFAYFIIILPINIFAITRMKPRNVVINPTTIDVTPIPFCGYASTRPATRNVSEFKSVDYIKVLGSKSVNYFLYLRGVAGTSDLRIDLPAQVDRHEFTAQLGAALKLQVNDYARN